MLTFGLAMGSVCISFAMDMMEIFDTLLLSRILDFISTAGFLIGTAWIYMIVTTFSRKLPAEVNINMQRFNGSLFYTVAFQLLNTITPGVPSGVTLILSIVALVCTINVHYIAAKVLVAAERQRNVTFNDFSGDFFAFLFYPIGVWWLQPRINDLANNGKKSVDPDAPLDQHLTM